MDMKSPVRVLILIAVLLMVGTASAVGPEDEDMRSDESIIVNGDSELDSLAQERGWKGDGSAANPYIIENYSLDASGNPVGIYLGNTTRYVVIRNTYIHGAHGIFSAPYYYRDGAAIKIYNAQNVRVENCTLSENDYGVYIYLSMGISVRGNHFEENKKYSIVASHTHSVYIEDNEMLQESIYVFGSAEELDSFTISDNNTVNGRPVYFYSSGNMDNLTVPRDAGEVIVSNVSYLRINSIEFLHSDIAVQVFYSEHIYITNVTVGDMKGGGIYEYMSSNVSVSNSRIYDIAGYGVELYNGNHNMVENNEFYGITGYMAAVMVREDYSTVRNNYIHDSPYGYGIQISSGTDDVILENMVMKNYQGIAVGRILDSVYNTAISRNVICNSTSYGISILKGSGHIIVGNILCYNNGAGAQYDSENIQARDDVGVLWNTTQGNFWLDWAANNWSNDANHDGIVDFNYTIAGSAGAEDCQPLKYSMPAPPVFSVLSGDGYVNLSWDAPITWGLSSQKEYRVYRDGSLLATLTPDTLYYNDTSVQNGQYYLYHIRAVNSKGWESIASLKLYAVPWGTNLTAHESIRIDGDAELENFTATEGLKGSGTPWDPYIISGYDIDGGSSGAGIYIGNTTKHFVIRDCHIHNTSMGGYIRYFSGSGVHLYNVVNFTVSDNVLESNRYGVHVFSSDYYGKGKIENNSISGGLHAVWLYRAWYTELWGNEMYGSGIYIEGGLSSSDYARTYTITSNTIDGREVYYYRDGYMGNAPVPSDAGEVIVANASHLKIENIAFSSTDSGVQIFTSSYIYVRNCSFEKGGITMRNTKNSVIRNNTLEEGIIYLAYSQSNIVSNNTVRNTTSYYHALYLSWSDYNIVGGNHLRNGNGGIMVLSSSYNQIAGNTVEQFSGNGIEINGATNQGNVIIRNILLRNQGYGVYLGSKVENATVYENIFYYNHYSGDAFNSGRLQGYDDGLNNRWNASRGNYWQDWANNNDTNDVNPQNGIVDWPYAVAGASGSADYLPLRYSVPTSPRSLVAVAGISFVNLSWSAPIGNGSSDIISYRIYRNGSLIATVPGTQLWYNDTNVTPGITYAYHVTALNSLGEGSESEAVYATPGSEVPELGEVALVSLAVLAAVLLRKRK